MSLRIGYTSEHVHVLPKWLSVSVLCCLVVFVSIHFKTALNNLAAFTTAIRILIERSFYVRYSCRVCTFESGVKDGSTNAC